jgi:hypothetical protein
MWAYIKKAINSTLGKNLKPLDNIIKEAEHETYYSYWESYLNVFPNPESGDDTYAIALFPRGIKNIPSDGDWKHRNLRSVVMPNGVLTVKNNAFDVIASESVIFPPSCENIEEYVFYKNSTLKSVKLPNSLKILGKSCFEHCVNLQYLDLPDSLREIGSYCFAGSGIKEIRIPEGVTTLKENCFWESSLEKLYLPSSINDMKAYSINASIRTIYYNGTVSNFKNLESGMWYESLFISAGAIFDVICTDGTLNYDFS